MGKITMTPAKLAANRLNALKGGRPVENHTIETREARRLAANFVNERLAPLLEALYKKAVNGDVAAFKELFDRAWGKAVQGLEVSGKDGNPIVFMPMELIQKHALDISKEEPINVNEDMQLLPKK